MSADAQQGGSVIRQIYPIVTTKALADCREFYVRLLGGTVVFEAKWYLQLRLNHSEIGFVHPDAPRELPLYRQAIVSKGLSLALEVDNASAELERLRGLGVETLGKPQFSDWGDFHFRLLDPAGTVINVLQRRDEHADVVEL